MHNSLKVASYVTEAFSLYYSDISRCLSPTLRSLTLIREENGTRLGHRKMIGGLYRSIGEGSMISVYTEAPMVPKHICQNPV